MTDCHNHNFQPHPNHPHRVCETCGKTPSDAIDHLLDSAEECVGQGAYGAALLALVGAVRLMWEVEG